MWVQRLSRVEVEGFRSRAAEFRTRACMILQQPLQETPYHVETVPCVLVGSLPHCHTKALLYTQDEAERAALCDACLSPSTRQS